MSMSTMMAVLLNGVAQIEYDRTKALPDYQGAYLDKMDRKMEAEGIDIDGQRIQAPALAQKAQFVAANLANAIVTNDEAQVAAMTTWLAVRLPELKQVKLREEEGGFAIELDFDQGYIKQHPVQITPRRH
ncbi:hypothetical protein U5801_13785 [Lamprobacter modestohalophilus]|uniref:hypothetical protein n=1 Tax=Lamprobacter modestohalophilus TaxID=1064514 RepID=UPI002ADEF0C8|nr:hypothetical protein [Lamprobacter modestohalophilus]MCF8003934.1 hypothetical protein [Chromatiaceae bacterium]MEA1050871.1 hypothetical protein [Lamprobacter modestohalophilus]